MAVRMNPAFVPFLVLSLVGCAAMDRHARRAEPAHGVVDPAQPRELNEITLPRHVVRSGDELQVSIRPTELGGFDQTVSVQSDGLIDLGFAGELMVNGLTIPEIEQRLTTQLESVAAARRVEGTVEVAVRLVDGSKSRRFYVLGVVQSPGSFPLTGRETVLDAIIQAGLRSNSWPEKAFLARPHPAGGPDTILHIDWCAITQRGDTLTNYQLMPGDRINVPGGRAPGLLQTLMGGR